MISLSIRKMGASSFLLLFLVVFTSSVNSETASDNSTIPTTDTKKVEDLKSDLEIQLKELVRIFERSKDFSSDKAVIYRFKKLIGTTYGFLDQLATSKTEEEVLRLYELTIRTLNYSSRLDQPLGVAPSGDPANDPEKPQTPITADNAQEQMDQAVSTFSIANAELLIQKTTNNAVVQRCFMKTMSYLIYYLSYAHLGIQEKAAAVKAEKKLQKEKYSTTFSDEIQAYAPTVLLNTGKSLIDAFIEEIVPSQDPTSKQQWAELIIPIITAHTISRCIIPDYDKKLRSATYNDLAIKEIFQLLIFTRFYLKPKSSLYKYANLLAYLSYFQKEEFLNFDKSKGIFLGDPSSFLAGLSYLACMEVPGMLDKSEWAAALNKKSRRKVIMQSIARISDTLRKAYLEAKNPKMP